MLSFIDIATSGYVFFGFGAKNEILEKKKTTSVSTENAKSQLFVKIPYVNQHIHNRIKFSILYNEPFYTEALDIIIIQKIF